MKSKMASLASILLIVFVGCMTTSSADVYSDLDTLLGDAAWNTLTILSEHYEDLHTADPRIIAVYPFREENEISDDSDLFIDGMSIELANTFREDGTRVNTVNRKNLDDILQELEFQNSDLASPEVQMEVGRQLGAHFIMNGTIFWETNRNRISFQLLEVETGIILGGFALYLLH